MNCHHARQLISPYLDGQLTGREMLDLGDHLAGCESCRDEMHSLRQIKTLLRGLHRPSPRLEFSRQLSSQEILSGSASWQPVLLPQRGRRLVAALALSCVTLLLFAPASRESQNAASYAPTSGFPTPSGLTLASRRVSPGPVPANSSLRYEFAAPSRPGFVSFSGPDISDRDFFDAQPYGEPPYGHDQQPYQPSLTAFQTVTFTQARPR